MKEGFPSLPGVAFDSYEIALAAYEDADYKKALAVLGPEVERDFRIAEGA